MANMLSVVVSFMMAVTLTVCLFVRIWCRQFVGKFVLGQEGIGAIEDLIASEIPWIARPVVQRKRKWMPWGLDHGKSPNAKIKGV